MIHVKHNFRTDLHNFSLDNMESLIFHSFYPSTKPTGSVLDPWLIWQSFLLVHTDKMLYSLSVKQAI